MLKGNHREAEMRFVPPSSAGDAPFAKGRFSLASFLRLCV